MQYQKILLIDDDVEDHEIFETALSLVSKQLSFISFTDAKLALDKLNTHEINADVIFLDLNMPVMSGEEFLIKIKSLDHLKQIPVIIYSTTSNASTISATKNLGAIDFITKPDRFDLLIDILKPIIN
jgi:DNA-binding NtrC family response regulator